VDSSLVGYDGGQDVRDEEQRMAAETDQTPATGREEQARRVPRRLVVLAVLVLAGGVVGVIVYGYVARPGWIGVADKRFWDYLDLLIVPAALAIGVYWLNRAQRQRELEAEDAQQARELQVENRRAQDEALQAYLDQMSQLLTDKDRPLHRASVGDSLSAVARARTLTVLTRLDGERKASVLQFLYESGLITKERAILDLSQADLRRVFLREAKLREANLLGANLLGAKLGGANLREADLREADVSRTKAVTNEELEQQVEYLEGATMPNGQKYDDWLKSKGSREDGESAGS
jgi:hypothetical protein